jgi:hypothetical protein
MQKASRRAWLAAASVALCAALAVPLVGMFTTAHAARAATVAPTVAPSPRHVVIVGISGLTWNLVTPQTTPELWQLAENGSVGSLVDYTQQPLSCPADGWLTLNSAARAQGPRPCASMPTVIPAGRGARVPAMPRLIAANQGFRESPDWGLLGSLASCATAVGPGAALALANPAGAVSSYLPSAAGLSSGVLARCPLTVVDLGQLHGSERSRLFAIDRRLAAIVSELPGGTLLLVTAPGAAASETAGAAPAGRPHLMSVVVSGPGYSGGLLTASSTRRPGVVVITDLTTTVAGWLGQAVPAGTVGARIGTTGRGGLAATVRGMVDRDTAEQVWLATRDWFLIGYAIVDALLFAVPTLLFWGSDPERRRRRAQSWRLAGTLAAAVPLGSFLANSVPWWGLAHPAWWLYGLTAGWTLVVAAAALAGPWRRDVLGQAGMICLATLLVLAVDVMSGSRLQLEAPFGLSLLVSGRYYGIGNDVLGIYCVSALVATAWLGGLAAAGRSARPYLVVAPAAVGVLAVVALGWPGFGAKVGGTIALVPCLVLLAVWLAGARVRWGWVAPVALSGLALFAAFAVFSYYFPAVGVSDMGTFAGNVLRGQGGDVVARKVGSNVGTLTSNDVGWLIPVLVVAAGVALWRPAALRLRTLAKAFEAAPLVRVTLWLSWLVLVIGWIADDSGVIVPAAALPFVVPLAIAMAASVSAAACGAGYFGNAFVGSSVAGRSPS